MSIDLEWLKLDASLSTLLVDALNKQLQSTARPSFIGPVEVTSLEFGTTSPDIELVDLCDIYRDFLEADDDDSDEEQELVKVSGGPEDEEDEEGFEWVSRRAAVGRADEAGPAYQHLPPHMRFGRGPTDMFASMPGLHPAPRDIWNGGMMSLPSLTAFSSWPNSPRTPVAALPTPPAPSVPQGEPASALPNVQLHLNIHWNSDLRITLTTSLLINYPSPMFMSLPIKLSITGLLFTGEIAVAYEGERKRVHLCILDDMDPYGPAGERPKRDSTPSLDLTPPAEAEAETPPRSLHGKPLPVGQRLLPNIYIESEIGQADKHVLKNVTRIERFIQDVIRKTVEEELVFPNFHTLVMGDGTA